LFFHCNHCCTKALHCCIWCILPLLLILSTNFAYVFLMSLPINITFFKSSIKWLVFIIWEHCVLRDLWTDFYISYSLIHQRLYVAATRRGISSSGNLKKGNALSELGKLWQPYNRQYCPGAREALDTNVLSLLSSVFGGLKQMTHVVKREPHTVIQLRDKIFVQKHPSTYLAYWKSSLRNHKTCCYDSFLIVFLSTARWIEK